MEKFKQSWLCKTFAGRSIITLGAVWLWFMLFGPLFGAFLNATEVSVLMAGFAVIGYVAAQFWVFRAPKDKSERPISPLAWMPAVFGMVIACAMFFSLIWNGPKSGVEMLANGLILYIGPSIFMMMAILSFLFQFIRTVPNIEYSYLGRITTLFVIAWAWFFACNLAAVSIIDTYNIIAILGFVAGIIGYIISLFWFCRAIVRHQPNAVSSHWLDLYINRFLFVICFVLIAVIACMLLALPQFVMFVSSLGIFGYESIMVGCGIFGWGCFLSLLFGWFLIGKFIQQSIITEGNIKAIEMHGGKKRTVNY